MRTCWKLKLKIQQPTPLYPPTSYQEKVISFSLALLNFFPAYITLEVTPYWKSRNCEYLNKISNCFLMTPDANLYASQWSSWHTFLCMSLKSKHAAYLLTCIENLHEFVVDNWNILLEWVNVSIFPAKKTLLQMMKKSFYIIQKC